MHQKIFANRTAFDVAARKAQTFIVHKLFRSILQRSTFAKIFFRHFGSVCVVEMLSGGKQKMNKNEIKFNNYM